MIYFITPAWRRYELTHVCLEQRKRSIGWLDAQGIEARCVVIADDENLDIARGLGFDTIERDNEYLGRRFNDGFEHAARQRAEWIVPIGSDSFIDPAYLCPLPGEHVVRSSSLLAIAQPGRLGLLRVRGTSGAAPYMIPRLHLPRSMRPAQDHRTRGIDSSTIRGLRRGWRRESVDLHPWQKVDFRHAGLAHPQLNPYNKLYGMLGVYEEKEPAERLSEYYPSDLVARALAACAPAIEAVA